MPGTQTDPPSLDHLAPKWVHDFWNAVCEWWKNERVVAGAGIMITDAPGGGKLLEIDSAALSSLIPRPFKPIHAPTTAQPKRIRIIRGVVNSHAPSGFYLADATPFYVNAGMLATGSIYIAAEVDVSGSLPDTVDANPVSMNGRSIALAAAKPADTLTTYYQEIGTFATTGGRFVVLAGGDGNGLGDQSFNLCGGRGGEPQWGPA